MRTIIDIPNEQLQQLAELCRREELSRSEAIRRAIALLLNTEAQHPDQAFGLWKDRGAEGVEYQQTLRKEWDQ
jgi:metal-responsive CopG/Arc/MetJ family transcriptional regulator